MDAIEALGGRKDCKTARGVLNQLNTTAQLRKENKMIELVVTLPCGEQCINCSYEPEEHSIEEMWIGDGEPFEGQSLFVSNGKEFIPLREYLEGECNREYAEQREEQRDMMREQHAQNKADMGLK